MNPSDILRVPLTLIAASAFISGTVQAEPLTRNDMAAMFDAAQSEGRVGMAKKTKLVDVRSAKPGEVIVTTIRGEGVETRSKPAKVGDMVVRNRCPETGHEEVLISNEKFGIRYEGPLDTTDATTWKPYRPRGVEMLFFTVGTSVGEFDFVAPWGEKMVAKSGDAIVRNPGDLSDIYRIAAAAFSCTYEVTRAPKKE